MIKVFHFIHRVAMVKALSTCGQVEMGEEKVTTVIVMATQGASTHCPSPLHLRAASHPGMQRSVLPPWLQPTPAALSRSRKS